MSAMLFAVIAVAALAAGAILWYRCASGSRRCTASNGQQLTWIETQQLIDTVADGLLTVDGDGRIERANAGVARLCGASPLGALGLPLAELPLFDEEGRNIPWPDSGTRRARLGRGVGSVDVEVTVNTSPTVPGRRLIHLRDVSVQVTSLKRAGSRERELRAIAELGSALNRIADERTLLQVVIESIAREIPIARSGGIFLVDRDAGCLRLAAGVGLDSEFARTEAEVPLGDCLCGRAAVSGEAIFSACSALDPWHTRQVGGASHGHIILPLRSDLDVLGVLFLYLEDDQSIDDDSRHLLEAAVSEISLAVLRVRATAELARQHGRLVEAFETAPDAVAVTDAEGNVERLNRRARAWFGASPSVAHALPWGRLLEERSRPAGTVRAVIQAPTGEVVADIAVSSTEDGKVQLVLRDVTREAALELKAAEAAKLEVASLLAAGLAHNLRNAFTAQIAHVELMKRALDIGAVDGAKSHAAAAIESAHQVSQLVGNLLSFGRPRAARLVSTDLSEVVARQLAILRPLTRSGIALSSEITPGLMAVTDPAILAEALTNLYLNAVEAMPEGGRLHVALTRRGEGRLALEVRDTGPGIPQETRRRIFEPFFTTKERGTGLGLGTVRAGVSALGGEIHLESSPSCGTSFMLDLPIVAPGAVAPGPLGVGTLLLVEDSALQREFVGRELARRGWHVVSAATVAEARARWSEQRPGFALVDWNLGGEVADELAAELAGAGVRVLVLTGDHEEMSGRGYPVVQKPIVWPDLERCLGQAMESEAVHGPLHRE